MSAPRDDALETGDNDTAPGAGERPPTGAKRQIKPLAHLPAGPVHWQVLVLATPVLGEQAVRFLVGFVDTYLAGQISKEATAAVGMAVYFTWLVILLFNLVTIGTIALVSRLMGAGDRKQANRVVNQALMLSVITGSIATVFAYFMAAPMAAALTQTQSAHDLLEMYLKIESLGFSLVSIAIVAMAVLRAAGDTRTPMLVMILMNIINVVVSVGLVKYVPSLGVAGIAVGTLAARAASLAIIIRVLWKNPRGFQVRRVLLWPRWSVIKRIMKISLPASADAGIMGFTQLAFATIVSWTAIGDLSTVNLAAHSIAMRMEAIGYLPAFAWATAGATVVGQYLGAKRPDDASKAGHSAALQVGAVTAVLGSSFILFPGLIFGWMTNDPEVLRVGVPAFRMLGFIQPILAMAIAYTWMLRNIGDSRMTLLFTIIGGVCLRVPVAYLGGVVLGGGLIGAWCGMWCDNIAKFILSGGRFLRGRWKTLEV